MPQGELNGWRYAYTDEGSGPPVLLLHGVLMDRSMWDHQIDALKDRFRCVAIDAPGHGESAGVEMGVDFYRYAEMVAGVCDQLGIDSAYWCGQSMGGFTSFRAALAMPERVKGLVLIDTQAHEEDKDKLAQYEAFLQVSLADGVSDDLAGVLVMLLFSGSYAAKPESDTWRKKLMSADIQAEHAMVRAVFDRDDIHDRLGEIKCPAIVIHGLEDVSIEPERGEEVARVLGATYVPIANAGHASPVEEPKAITTAIATFLDAQR
ncbi:MAG: alpha/beta fold hydrolase [Actinomycetota bacterium]